MAEASNMICPACQKFQLQAEICTHCGVVVAKVTNPTEKTTRTQAPGDKKPPLAMIAIVLLGTILAFGVVTFSGDNSDVRDTGNQELKAAAVETPKPQKVSLGDRRQQDRVRVKLRSLRTSLYMLGTEGLEPPSNEEGLQVLVDQGMLNQVDITDEWGSTFQYRLEWGKVTAFEKHYEMFVHSSGPDGISGTTDDVAML